jgi:hypothetical protein
VWAGGGVAIATWSGDSDFVGGADKGTTRQPLPAKWSCDLGLVRQRARRSEAAVGRTSDRSVFRGLGSAGRVSPPDTAENLNLSQAARLALQWMRVPKVQGNLLALKSFLR